MQRQRAKFRLCLVRCERPCLVDPERAIFDPLADLVSIPRPETLLAGIRKRIELIEIVSRAATSRRLAAHRHSVANLCWASIQSAGLGVLRIDRIDLPKEGAADAIERAPVLAQQELAGRHISVFLKLVIPTLLYEIDVPHIRDAGNDRITGFMETRYGIIVRVELLALRKRFQPLN